MLRSPIDGVSDPAWSEYFNHSVRPGPIPRGLLGVFHFRLESLEDIGLVEKLVKSDGKMTATWKGTDKKQFLSSVSSQYAAFKKQAVLHHEWLQLRYYPSIGAVIESRTASASGLMSVIRHLGIGCFEKWLDGDRLQRATEIFAEMNEIF